jgi:hypothetical protein
MTLPLQHSISLYNIDGSPNSAGSITHFARLRLSVGTYEEWTDFLVADIGGEGVILGHPWLRKANPDIDWEKGLLWIPPWCRTTLEEIPEPNPIINSTGINGTLMEERPSPNPKPPEPLFSKTPETPPATEPFYYLNGNRQQCRAWLRAGLISSATDRVWCAASYTYSQQIAEEAN